MQYSDCVFKVSGQSPRDVAKQLRDQQMYFNGYRDESRIFTVLMIVS